MKTVFRSISQPVLSIFLSTFVLSTVAQESGSSPAGSALSGELVNKISGPAALKLVRGFRDEALRGEWKGYRSSRLNQQYRVIYQIEGDRLKVFVAEVTPHNYRRKS